MPIAIYSFQKPNHSTLFRPHAVNVIPVFMYIMSVIINPTLINIGAATNAPMIKIKILFLKIAFHFFCFSHTLTSLPIFVVIIISTTLIYLIFLCLYCII